MNGPDPRPQRSRLRLAVGLLLAAAALYFAAREIDFGSLVSAWGQVRAGWVLAALALATASHAGKALRWRVLLSGEPHSTSFGTLLLVVLAGQLVNLFVPGRAGDWGRALALGRRGPGRLFTLGTIALEKLLDLFVYALIVAVVLVAGTLPDWLGSSPAFVLALAALGLLVLVIALHSWDRLAGPLARAIGRLPEGAAARLAHLPTAAASALQSFRQGPQLAALAGWSALAWAANALTNHALFLAFNIQAPLIAGLALLVVLQAGISAGLAPGAIGVFEYLCILVLGMYGVGPDEAFAYGVLLHAVALAPLAAGGALAFVRRLPGL